MWCTCGIRSPSRRMWLRHDPHTHTRTIHTFMSLKCIRARKGLRRCFAQRREKTIFRDHETLVIDNISIATVFGCILCTPPRFKTPQQRYYTPVEFKCAFTSTLNVETPRFKRGHFPSFISVFFQPRYSVWLLNYGRHQFQDFAWEASTCRYVFATAVFWAEPPALTDLHANG